MFSTMLRTVVFLTNLVNVLQAVSMRELSSTAMNGGVMAMDGFLSCPSALPEPMTAAQCYDTASRSCQTPRVVQRLPAKTIQEAMQSGSWSFIKGKLVLKKDFLVVSSTLFVPAGAEVVKLVSVNRKQELDLSYVQELPSSEVVEVSFLNPSGAHNSPYCARCVSWTTGIQHSDSFVQRPYLARAKLEKLGTCSLCEMQCFDVRGQSDSWQYLFTTDVERLEVQVEIKADPLPRPPACVDAHELVLEDRCKLMSSDWARMAKDCKQAWCAVDTCNFGFRAPHGIDCISEATTTTATTTTAVSLRGSPSWTPRETPTSRTEGEEGHVDVRLHFLYVIGGAAGVLFLCSCLVGCCSLLKSLNEERNMDQLSHSESRKPSVLKRHAEQATLVAAFVPTFVRSYSGRHLKKVRQMSVDPVVPQFSQDDQCKRGSAMSAWEDDNISTCPSSHQSDGGANSRRPSWQSDSNSGMNVLYPSLLQPSSSHSKEGSKCQSHSKVGAQSLQLSFQTSSAQAGKESRRPSWQSNSSRQSSLQPSCAQSVVGSRRPSWQSGLKAGSMRPQVFLQSPLPHSGAGSRRPSWQSDSSSGVRNSLPSVQSPPLQPGVFSVSALHTVGNVLRSHRFNEETSLKPAPS